MPVNKANPQSLVIYGLVAAVPSNNSVIIITHVEPILVIQSTIMQHENYLYVLTPFPVLINGYLICAALAVTVGTIVSITVPRAMYGSGDCHPLSNDHKE
ncbi:MAG: hypothetical protein ACP5GZ_08050 [Vulcanisaeta sp.]|jgi:hypothetical protein|uniref:hypothetical protein n=1 Tax=Vulcanisaeta sp. TaxID=2020871 RepID=UPI003D0CBBC6